MPYKNPEIRATYLKAYKKANKSDAKHYRKYCEQIKQHVKAYMKANPDKTRIWQRRALLKRRYGITPEQYDILFAAQNGRCALCPSVPKQRRLHIDHDHVTKKVRGLLCYRCNNFLVSGNTLETARKVVAYLEQFV
jgi:hypothetical protein